MPETHDRPLEELEDLEDAADLPDRRAMSLLDPGALLGAGGGLPLSPTNPTAVPASPTDAPTPGPATAAPASPGFAPNIPLPMHNPGGTYSPASSTSSQT